MRDVRGERRFLESFYAEKLSYVESFENERLLGLLGNLSGRNQD